MALKTDERCEYLEPNPHYGHLKPADYPLAAYVIVRILGETLPFACNNQLHLQAFILRSGTNSEISVWNLPLFLLTYPLIHLGSPTPFGENLFRYLIRTYVWIRTLAISYHFHSSCFSPFLHMAPGFYQSVQVKDTLT
jgi:hypothetical protein